MSILKNACGFSSSENLEDVLSKAVTSAGENSANSDSGSGSDAAVTRKEESVITPFLTTHISDQALIPKDDFHQYCYRHNPAIQCNKSTDAKKMGEIQHKLEEMPRRDREAISHVWSIFSAAPNQHRMLILQGLLSQCCFPQLSLISQEVSSLIKIDFITTLPSEISLKILCYLDCASLCNAAQVSRKWKTLADDDRVWHHMCEQHIDRKCPQCGWGLPLMHIKRNRRKRSFDEVDNEGSNNNKGVGAVRETIESSAWNTPQESLNRKTRPWKVVYSERYKVERNWRRGIYRYKQFRAHSDGVTCLQFDENRLITGSYDTTVKVWDTDTGNLVTTLAGHTRGVRCLRFDKQKVITGGLDATIKVWNLQTGQCISTYRGHEDTVCSVDFHDKTIVSGSADHTVKVWQVCSRTCYTLRGHTDWVNCVRLDGKSNTCFSASDDTTVRMWDLNTNQCLRVFGGMENGGHLGQVQCVIPLTIKDKLATDDENEEAGTLTEGGEPLESGDDFVMRPEYPTHILTSSLDNTIRVWSVKTGKCIRTQFGHIEGVWSIAADTFRIISGAHDRLIKVWDLQSGKCMHTFGGNTASVSCVELGDSRFACGLENGDVKMYSFDDFQQ